MDEKKGLFDLLDSKAAFGLGFVTAILLLCTLGFIGLGYMYFHGGLPSMAGSQQAMAQQQAPAPAANPSQQPAAPTGPVNVATGQFPVLGKSSAKVKVIEFADLRCPFCERWYQDSEKQLITDYVNTGKIQFAFRNFAFLGPESTTAAQAAVCANAQGAFWKFHDWMYEHQADESDTAYYSNDNLIKYATDLGMDKTKFTSCLTSTTAVNAVASDLADGQTAGVSGTPTIFVDGVAIVGDVPYAQLKSAIDAELAK